jgi:bacillithiol synthase
MHLDTYLFQGGRSIADYYREQFGLISDLYDYSPWDSGALRARADWLKERHISADRQALVEVLTSYNQTYNSNPAVMEHIRNLADPQTLTVVGGQQAGLFGGAMLVVYKAMTIIQEAREAEASLGVKVVPVFWIAGEDHDFDEVNHMYTLPPEGPPHRIRLDNADAGKAPISLLNIRPEEWMAALDSLGQSLLDTEFKPRLMEELRDLCLGSETMSEAFARLMGRLFGRYGLVLVDSSDRRLRRLEGRMFHHIVADNEGLNEANIAGRVKVERLGFTAQADVYAGQANLFVLEEGERLLLLREEEGFSDRNRRVCFTKRQLEELALNQPEQLSNNVLTRPLMQEYLFPVLSTVLGSGEIAYWSLLKEAFHRIGFRMPILVPRLSFTIVEAGIQKQMAKYELTMDDVFLRIEERKAAWLESLDHLQLDRQFAEVRAGFDQLYSPLLEAVSSLNPGMRQLGNRNKHKIMEQIDYLAAKSQDAIKVQNEAGLRQWDRIQYSLHPFGKPQERVYNMLIYFNKYGDDWLHELLSIPINRDGLHRLVYL